MWLLTVLPILVAVISPALLGVNGLLKNFELSLSVLKLFLFILTYKEVRSIYIILSFNNIPNWHTFLNCMWFVLQKKRTLIKITNVYQNATKYLINGINSFTIQTIQYTKVIVFKTPFCNTLLTPAFSLCTYSTS